MGSRIKDAGLADNGRKLLSWAEDHMPVVMRIRERFSRERPLLGIKVAACLHVTKETGVLVRTLMEGGAEVALAGSNPLSTQDEVASALSEEGAEVFAWRGQSKEEYYGCLEEVASRKPDLTMDDGADLVTMLHSGHGDISRVVGGTEETTTGVVRIKSMASRGVLRYPVIAVNNAETKWDFDNVYGTGQSTLDGIMRATNVLLAGKTFVVAGYGHCGRGLASRARGMGARVVVTEVDPMRALKALMDGYAVMPMGEAARVGDIFVTATGNKNVIRKEHLEQMKNGAILANTGHFNVEIDLGALEAITLEKRRLRESVDEYMTKDGKKLYLLADGRLVNLACAEGHPSEVMDMSFANQALSVEYLLKEKGKLETKVYDVPREIDESVARLKLETLGVSIDRMTKEQEEYIKGWSEGTE